MIGTAALATESGQDGEVSGMTLSVKQTAYVQGNTLNAEHRDEPLRQRLAGPAQSGSRTTSTSATSQSGRRCGAASSSCSARSAVQGGGLDGPVFYIVHWPENE